MNVVSNHGRIAWAKEAQAPEFKLVHGLDDAMHAMRRIRDEQVFYDLHAWCFTPHSFRLLMSDLFQLGLTALKEVAFHPSSGCEFFIALSRGGSLPDLSRLQMLELAKAEQAE